MRIACYGRVLASMLIAVSGGGVVFADGADSAASAVSDVETSLSDLDQWIGDEANGQKWRKFLATAALRKQIAAGAEADPAVVSRVLEKYRSDVDGLQKPGFAQVRQALEVWLTVLQAQYAEDLAKLAWASRGDYAPASIEGRLAALRAALRSKAQLLEKELGTDSKFAQNWKRYLRWEMLEPHFVAEVKVNKVMLANLDLVLKRFRANRPGLELPVFMDTTTALSDYRGLYAWHGKVREVGKRSRKKYSPADLQRRVYIIELLGLQKSLTEHQESPTVETTQQISESLGLIENLGQSPQLVAAMRKNYSQPNVLAKVSEAAINQLAKRPVEDTQPVRDVILGAQIRGTAHSTGQMSFQTIDSKDHVELELQITGNIHSNTTAYKKPVCVVSEGDTSFVSTKQLQISDDEFLMMPSCTTAKTNNTVCSVRKTGGDFGRNLIEKIAWKQVRKNKGKSQVIAARHAEKKVSAKFDKQVSEAIYQARQNYDQKVRAPLIRTGMFPEDFRFASSESAVDIQLKMASYDQVSTDVPASDIESVGDLSLKLHETAVNNFLPTILGGLGIQQDTEAGPPQINGDAPPWLKELAEKKSKEREAELKQEQSSAVEETVTDPGEDVQAETEFKPFSIRLNNEYPLSVSFDDQKISIRIRVAEMKTFENGEETIRNDWDFLVTFAIENKDRRVVLRRVGDVETLPTGFDPRWDTKLNAEQVATRGALAKILNKRSAEGKGFPEEISLPQVEIPGPNDTKIVPILQQLHCDDGWLAIGYQLP